jgi:hypothetical protein
VGIGSRFQVPGNSGFLSEKEEPGGNTFFRLANQKSRRVFINPGKNVQNPKGKQDTQKEFTFPVRKRENLTGKSFSGRELPKPDRDFRFPPGILKTSWEFSIPGRG